MGRQRGCRLGLRGALRLVGGVGQAGSPVWVPGLAFCPVKAPWGETSAEIAFSAQRSGQRLWSLWPLPLVCCGGVLLSHNPSVAVPSALPGLASRFGMLLGVSPVL